MPALPPVKGATPVIPSVLPPVPTTFTSAFHAHMEAAENIYSHFHTATAVEKAQMHTELDQAYVAVSIQMKKDGRKGDLPATITGQQVARLLFLEGCLLFDDNSIADSSYFFMASFIFHIVHNHSKDFKARLVHALDSNVTDLMPREFRKDLLTCSGLKELRQVFITRHVNGTMPKLNEWLMKTKKGDVPFRGDDALVESMQAGICLRRLGKSELALMGTNPNRDHVKAILGHAEAFLTEPATKASGASCQDANLELAKLFHSQAMFIHSDSKEKIKCLHKSLECFNKAGELPRSREREAGVRFMLACVEADTRPEDPKKAEEYLAITKTCFDHVSKACDLIEKNVSAYPPSGRGVFFIRRAALALDSLERGREIAKPEEIEQWNSKALTLITREADLSNMYIRINEARLAIHKNDKANALASLEQAEKIYSQTCASGNNKNEKAILEALRKKIATGDNPAAPKDKAAAASNLTATHRVTDKVTREWKEFAIAILIVTIVSAVFIAIGVVLAAPLLIASGPLTVMTGGLLLYRWHYNSAHGLITSTHYTFAIAYPSAFAVAAVAVTIFNPIPAAIVGAFGLLIAGAAIYKGELATP